MEAIKTFFAVLGLAHVVCFFAFVAVTWWAGRGRWAARVEGEQAARQLQDGVLWEFDEVIDQRTGMTQPHPVTLKDAASAAITAAMPAIREAIAQEIEADDDGTYMPAATAARIVRGGAE
jgi:hypothetical protein